MYGFYYETPVGVLGIAVEADAICRISFGRLPEETVRAAEYEEKETELHREAKRQMEEYFSGERQAFDLPLVIRKGTDFQRRVWEALREIPYGETRSYKQIAEAVGSPKGCRAVGMANRNNPIPIIIPCHRVIGSNGSMVGFMGGEKRIDMKEQLLLVERKSPHR